jgi:hypothetical protein
VEIICECIGEFLFEFVMEVLCKGIVILAQVIHDLLRS